MKWTAEDEQRFQEQSRRREAAIKARELPVKALIDKQFTGMKPEEKSSMFFILTKHADDFRDVLAPYDSGVRPAAPQTTLTAVVPTCPAPMPEVLWQRLPPGHGDQWPDHLKPSPLRKFEVKLRNGHVIHEIPDTLTVGWTLINDPSDIIAWRYV